MNNVSTWLLSQSPLRLGYYLLVFPLVLVLLHTILSIVARNIEGPDTALSIALSVGMWIVILAFALLFLIWVLWLRTVALEASEDELNIPVKWFKWGFAVFILHLLFILAFEFYDSYPEFLQQVMRMTSEIIRFAGLIVAYPIICHFAARAIQVKKKNRPASLIESIPNTLLLVFGTVLIIPIFHKHFYIGSMENSSIKRVYFLALGLLFALFILGLAAAIAGWI